MNSTTIVFSEDTRKRLQTLLKDKSLPWQIVKRLETIRLLEKGCTSTMVSHQLALRKELVRKYAGEFMKGGLEALLHLEKPGKETLLTEEKFRALETYIQEQKKKKKKCSLKDLTSFLTQTYGITMSEEWLSKRLATRKQALKEAPWR